MDLSRRKFRFSSQRQPSFQWLMLALLLTLTPRPVAAENPLQIWLYSIYPPEVMRNKTQPFIDYLQQRTGLALYVRSSSISSTIIESCVKGLPHVIISSTKIGKKIASTCGYTTIAVTYQPLFLFVENNSNFKTIDDVQRFGGIINSDAKVAMAKELALINRDIEVINYPTLIALMKGRGKDRLEGLILAKAIIKAAPLLEQDHHPIHAFHTHGRGMVLVSPLVAAEQREKFAAVLLENSPISEKVWQQGIGAGAFLSPTSAP